MTAQRVHVVATGGRSVPMESSASIIQSTPVAVMLTHYYRRRIASGELELAPMPTAVQKAGAAPELGGDADEHPAIVITDVNPLSADADAPRSAPTPDQDQPTSRRRPAP
jgi:hypothetical protein